LGIEAHCAELDYSNAEFPTCVKCEKGFFLSNEEYQLGYTRYMMTNFCKPCEYSGCDPTTCSQYYSSDDGECTLVSQCDCLPGTYPFAKDKGQCGTCLNNPLENLNMNMECECAESSIINNGECHDDFCDEAWTQ
jgi:hypothetical protein